MKTFRLSLITLLASIAACSLTRADTVTEWNSMALDAIKADRTPPPAAARFLAMMHVAIFDACNGISRNYEPYFVTEKPAGVASKETAIAAAAHRMLILIFPARQVIFDAVYTRTLNEMPDGPARQTGVEWGEFVADAIWQLRSRDGSADHVSYTPGSGPGMWIPTMPAFAPALLPNWPFVKPFAMATPDQFRPSPPPALDSVQWASDFNLTKEIGRLDSSTRTPEQAGVAHFWADGAGTVTPPGHWNVIARDVALQQGKTMDENARLFAWLNLALADAGIVAWDCKYTFNFWRPITAIHNAESDGNPVTASDAAWAPLLVTPPFPEYISGHSTFSGAAAAVLVSFFGADQVPFSTKSDDLPGVSRSYQAFSEAASEAGMSRIYGGIHFMSANLNGLSSGAELGRYVTSHYLRPRPGRSQRGQ